MVKPAVRSDVKVIRTSISLPAAHYRELEQIAQGKKVSIAWVVREAIEKYLAEQLPLFNQELHRGGEK